jgi:GTP-binding protein
MRFLRHVERTRLLVHLIDTSDSNDDDPIHSYEVISGELAAFSKTLTEKPLIVVATKLDATTDRTRLDALRDFCQREHLEFHSISAATGEGVKDLVRSIADALDKIPRPAPGTANELDAADDPISHSSSINTSNSGEDDIHAPVVSHDEKS